MLVNEYQISKIKYQNVNLKFKICKIFCTLICNFNFCILIFAFYLIFTSCICLAQDKIDYDSEGRRDPFMALVTPDGRLLNLEPTGDKTRVVLGGVIYDESGSSYAIINDEVVSVGDYILGYTVFSIDENKVVLLKDDEQVEYILEKEEL